ncbi:monocyte chemotactic protein 1B-like [Myxocyprinus asiaticus]|uniref:monocyte chemotactic protein 1B-like n=1 Tax=Myxocyprinus asiaticus TaxID=70543 RepID=UPI002223D49C|nr:monocyte chemotactic protein 1B-like [Myxocyprinus asiaticus]
MKSLMSLIFLVLFCSMQLASSSTLANQAAQSTCCSEFTNLTIPLRCVVSYKRTSSYCPKEGIVFLTIAGKKICADPQTAWVSNHIAKVDKRTTSTGKSSSTTV